MNYREAKALLDGEGKRRGPRDRLKIARNTYLERGYVFEQNVRFEGFAIGARGDYSENAIGLRFHETYVLVFTPTWTEFYTGGFHTMSTAERMRYAYAKVYSDKRGWAIYMLVPRECGVCEGSGLVSVERYARSVEYEFGTYVDGKLVLDRDAHPAGSACPTCQGRGSYNVSNWDSGGHPFYDGIRTSPDGMRLMREQPHRPEVFRPIYTVSWDETKGWS